MGRSRCGGVPVVARATLIFVYNADSGLFNTLSNAAHKLLSPKTYRCNLCRITHGHLGMHEAWRTFVESRDVDAQFLHRDELASRYGIDDVVLPAVYQKVDDASPQLWIGAQAINAATSIDDLRELINQRLSVTDC